METKQVRIVIKKDDELVTYHPETIAKSVLVDDKTLDVVLNGLSDDQNEIKQKIDTLMDQVPEELDTLKEIADKLKSNDNLHDSLITTISNKVDKVAGKQLSSEDFTSTLKTKLEQLQNYTHPSTHSADMITENANRRFVSDAEKNLYNSKTKVVVTSNIADLENGDVGFLIVE